MNDKKWREKKFINNQNQSTDQEIGTTNRENKTQKINKQKYKSQICKNYSEIGWCKYGEKCQYAHGKNELNKNDKIKKKIAYRTKRCKSFWEQGLCPYGKRCQFSHYEWKSHDKIDKTCLSLYLDLIKNQLQQGQSRLLNQLFNLK